MRGFALFLTLLLLPAHLAAQAPDFTGSFSMQGDNGTVVLSLQAAANGKYAGTMSNSGLTWQVQGDIHEDALTGMVDTGQGTLAFEAHVSGTQLQFILVPIGPDGMPLVDQGQEFLFTRTQNPAGQGSAPAQAASPSASFPGFSQGGNAAADPFVGSFTNGELTLSLQSANGGYSGQLALGQEAFPVAARRNGDRVEGTMNAPTGQYGIIISASADGVVVSNDGNEYALRRVTAGGQGGAAQQQAQSASGGSGQPGQTAAQVDDSPLAQQWRAHMAGRKVTYMDSYSSNTAGGGGYSTKFVYHLCSDGQFAYSGSDVVSLNLPNTGVEGGGSAGSSSGMWRIVTEGQLAGIEFRFGNGQVQLFRLDMQGEQTFANGSRVYVTPGEVCN